MVVYHFLFLSESGFIGFEDVQDGNLSFFMWMFRLIFV